MTATPVRPAPRPAPLEPLKRKRTRIKLLLHTLEDASESLRKNLEVSDKPTSRALSHNHDLWEWGSYPETQRALDQLRTMRTGKWRGAYNAVWAIHVKGSTRHMPRRKPQAELGLDYLEANTPDTIHVPIDVSLNAGYDEWEAGLYARRRALAA